MQALLRDDVLYSSFHPMNFLGNHDTPRVASRLTHAEHNHLALTFLFACRGIPALYYGDELGLKGDKGEADAGWGGDAGMRQAMPPPPDELKLTSGTAGGDMEAEARRTLRLTRELARMHSEVEVLRIGSQEGHFVVRARAPHAPSPSAHRVRR
jgi:glycosidase